MDKPSFESAKRARASQKLASHLAGLTSERSLISIKENEVLSLIVDEALKGVDIESQYPDFYGRLLKNAALRDAFLDTLEMMEAEKDGQLTPLPAGKKPSLDFLRKKPSQTETQQVGMEHWQIRLQRTIHELRNIFSSPKLAYRADANLYDDNWFTVLRDEIELAGSSYAILLECGISKETEEALSASLNLALTLEAATSSGSPIYATLHWGEYNETITIAEEGYTRFPDIPFSATFDQQSQEISADLDLVLEIKPA
jgi:hypothetical protein